MSQENVDAIHRGVDAMNRGELDAILDMADDEIVWEPLRASFEGEYRGHAGMRRFWADTAESFELFEVRYAELWTWATGCWRSARSVCTGATAGRRPTSPRRRSSRSATAGSFTTRTMASVARRSRRQGSKRTAGTSRSSGAPSRRWATQTTYRGHEGLRRWWEDLAEAFGDFRIVLEERVEVDEQRVLTTQRFVAHFRTTDIPFDGRWASIIWIRDGKVVRGHGHLSRRRALRAAGLPVQPDERMDG